MQGSRRSHQENKASALDTEANVASGSKLRLSSLCLPGWPIAAGAVNRAEPSSKGLKIALRVVFEAIIVVLLDAEKYMCQREVRNFFKEQLRNFFRRVLIGTTAKRG